VATKEAGTAVASKKNDYEMFTMTTWLLKVRPPWSESSTGPRAASQPRSREPPGSLRHAMPREQHWNPFPLTPCSPSTPTQPNPTQPNPQPLQEEQKKTIDGELATVLASVALACKQISSLVSRSGISNLTGAAGAQNVQGEDQKKLDVISNDVFCNCLRSCGRAVSGPPACLPQARRPPQGGAPPAAAASRPAVKQQQQQQQPVGGRPAAHAAQPSALPLPDASAPPPPPPARAGHHRL
jgi:hypothetical protein